MVGIGPLPSALAEAGIRMKNGIAVEVTSVSNIFAAGDCGSFPLAL